MESENKPTVSTAPTPLSASSPKKMSTLWVIILCAVGVVLLCVVTAAGIHRLRSDMTPKITSKDFVVNGLAITLDDSFGVYEDQPNVVMSDEYAYTVIKSDFSLLADGGEMTAHGYLDTARGLNHVAASDIRTAENGVEYFTFTDTVEGKDYHYFVFTVKGEHSFYIGQFFCEKNVNSTTRDADFAAWAYTAKEVPEEPSSGT